MPGTGPGGGAVGRDMDVPGTPVQDMDVQDHPYVILSEAKDLHTKSGFFASLRMRAMGSR